MDKITYSKLLDLFDTRSTIISGRELQNHFELDSKSKENFFFNHTCHRDKVLTINPGYEEASAEFGINDYGLNMKSPIVIEYFRNKIINEILY